MHRLVPSLDALRLVLRLDRPEAARTVEALLRALPMPVDLHAARIAGRHLLWHAPFVVPLEAASEVSASPLDLPGRLRTVYRPPGHRDGSEPLAEPLFADLSGLPPLVVAAAEFDPLLDESRALAERLAAAGVRHELVVWPGLAHGTLPTTRALDAAVVALERLGQRLRRLLQEDRP